MFNPKTIYSFIMNIEAIRRQSLIASASQVLLTLFGFLSTMYFSHTVGASTLGAYFVFTAYYGIITLFGDAGFGGAVVKRISEGKDPEEYFSAFVVLRIILLSASISGLFILRPYLADLNEAGVFPWLAIALIVGLFSNIVGNGIYGLNKVGVYQIEGMLNNLSRIFFQVIAVFIGFGIAGLVGGFVFGLLAEGIFGCYFLELKLKPFRLYHLKNLLSFSFWIFLVYGGNLVFNYADIIMIGYFMQNADVGIYRVAFQMASITSFITIVVKVVMYPKISNWSTNGKLDMVEFSLTEGFTYSLAFAVPILTGGLLLGDKMLYFFYGEDFMSGITSLYTLFLVQLINIFMFLQTTYLNGLDKPKKAFKVTLIAATANIVLNILLIPVLGIFGAALATLFTMMINATLAYLELSKLIKVKINPVFLRNILISAIAMAGIVGVYRLVIPISNVWLTLLPVGIGAVVYGTLLLKLDPNIRYELINIASQTGIFR